MKTPRLLAALVLLTALLSWMAPARGAGTLNMNPPISTPLTEPSPGTIRAVLEFYIQGGPWTGPGELQFKITLSPGDIVLKTGTMSLGVPWTDVYIPYTSLPPNGAADLVFTPLNASAYTGLTIQSEYRAPHLWGTIARRLTVSGGSIAEGQSGGGGALPFTITLDKTLSAPLTFSYAGSGGSAVSGVDYPAAPLSATIPAGQTSVTVHLPITGDTNVEENETVGLQLTNFSLFALMGTKTNGTILTDDYPPGPAPSPIVVTELPGGDNPQAWFSLDLPAARTAAVICRVSTRNDTAVAGSDYRVLAPVDITFAPGEVRKWVSITITPSAVPDASEQFFLDVEALDSHEVKSAACTIEPLTPVFDRAAHDIYRLRFPAGTGQRYQVEESADLITTAGWTTNSGVFTGAGTVITHLMPGDTARKFFRLKVLTTPPPGTAAASS